MAGWDVTMNGLADVHRQFDRINDMYGDMSAHVVVAGVPYAVYVEFGTSDMPANGALRKSIKQTMSNIENVASKADDGSQLTRVIAEDIAKGYRQDVWVDTGRLRDSITVEEQ